MSMIIHSKTAENTPQSSHKQSASAGSFKSLSKVRFTLPSWYFFSVCPSSVLSFEKSLPPTLHSTSKEHDSQSKAHVWRLCKHTRASHPCKCTLSSFPRWLTLATPLAPHSKSSRQSIQQRISAVSKSHVTRSYLVNPCLCHFLRLLICLDSAGVHTCIHTGEDGTLGTLASNNFIAR